MMSFLKDLFCGCPKDVDKRDMEEYGDNSALHRPSESTNGFKDKSRDSDTDNDVSSSCEDSLTTTDSNQISEYPCRSCDVLCYSPERFEEHCNTDDHKTKYERCRRFENKSFTKPNEIGDFRRLQLFDINASKAGLTLTKNGINGNSICVNYDDLAEFTVSLEAPLNFILNKSLDFGDNNKTVLKALKIEDETDSSFRTKQQTSLTDVENETDNGLRTKQQTSLTFHNKNNNPIVDFETGMPSGSKTKVDLQESYLKLKVVETKDYVAINSQICVQLKNWHCVIGSVSPHCSMCNWPADNLNEHVKNGAHLSNLKNRRNRILAKYGNNLVMQLPLGDLHCGICNIRGFNLTTIDVHIQSQHHLNYYAQSELRFKQLKAPMTSEIKQELALKINSLVYAQGKGVLLNEKIVYSSVSWNACIVQEKTHLHCIVCDILCIRSVGPKHWQTEHHLEKLKSMPILNQFGYHAIRRITDNFLFCTICSMAIGDTSASINHIKLELHKENHQKCINDAKDVIERRIPLKKLR